MGRNLSTLNIKDTYEGLVQISGSILTDGTGSVIPSLEVTASYADSSSADLQQVTDNGNTTTNNITAPTFYTSVDTGIDQTSVSIETTTGSPYLYTDSTTTILFDSASLSTEFKGYGVDIQTSLTASGLNYPTADGTVGQALTTDGAGNLALTTVTTAVPTLGEVLTAGNTSLPLQTLIMSGSGLLERQYKADEITSAIAGGNFNVQGGSSTAGLVLTGNGNADNKILITPANGVEISGSLKNAGLIYPTADGTVGQVIETDGAGNLSFATTASTPDLQEVLDAGSIATGSIELYNVATNESALFDWHSNGAKFLSNRANSVLHLGTTSLTNGITIGRNNAVGFFGDGAEPSTPYNFQSGGGNIKVPFDFQSSFTASGLNYPTVDGTTGQVIETDGSGNLSFVTSGGGGGGAASGLISGSAPNSLKSDFYTTTNALAEGSGSIAIGDNSQVTGSTSENTVVIGKDANSKLNSVRNVIVGYNARMQEDNRNDSVIIGANAAGYQEGVAIGADAFTIYQAVAIGKGAYTNDNYAVAVGAGAKVNNAAGIAIGSGSLADGNNAIAIGQAAHATAEGDVVINNGVGDVYQYDKTTTTTTLAGTLAIDGISDVSASIAAGGGAAFPFTGSAGVSGSVVVTSTSTDSITIDDKISINRPLSDTNVAFEIYPTTGGPAGGTYSISQTGTYSTRVTPTTNGFIYYSGRGGQTKRHVFDNGLVVSGDELVVRGLTYPTADGTAGQVIETDGAGNLSFATAGGAAFPFTGSAGISGSLTVSGSVQGNVGVISDSAGTITMDCSTGNFFTLAMPAGVTTTLTPTNIQAGQTISVKITQNATPSTLNFAGSIEFANKTGFNISTLGGEIDVMTFISFDGTTLQATGLKDFG